LVLTVSFALSPVIGLFVTALALMREASMRDASVEASGPHDFTVRFHAVRLPAQQRPSHPAQRS
jgi:hypothetical protein